MERDYDYIQELLKEFGWGDIISTERPEEFEQTAYYSDGMTDEEYAEAFDKWLSRVSQGELNEGEGSIHTKKWDRCVNKVKDGGKSEESAYRICSSSIKDAGVKKTHQRKKGKQYYANRKEEETNESTGAASSGQFSGPFMRPIKRKINEAKLKGTPTYVFDQTTAVGVAEGWIDAKNEEHYLAAWQYLVDTGLAWQLQGWFGRTATDLINSGEINPPTTDLKEALECAYKDGSIITNEMLESELDEATSTTSVGANSPTGSFGYEVPGVWAKDSKNMRFNKKTTWPGGSFVSVKEKCKKFPYCNQGDTGALNFSNSNVSKNNQLSENDDIYNKTKIMGTANKLKELERIIFKKYLTENETLSYSFNYDKILHILSNYGLSPKVKNLFQEFEQSEYFSPEFDEAEYAKNFDSWFDTRPAGDDLYEARLKLPFKKRKQRQMREEDDQIDDRFICKDCGEGNYDIDLYDKNNPEHKTLRRGSFDDAINRGYEIRQKHNQRNNMKNTTDSIEEIVNDELMRMYENKRKNVRESSEPGMNEYQKAHKKSGENNRAANKASMENAARLNKQTNKTEDEKLSAIGKGEPKYGNFDKKKFEKESDYIDILRGNGLEDIQFDVEPAEDYKKRAEEAITGSARMGNDPNYANAMRDFNGEKGNLAQRIIKTAKKKNDFRNKADGKENTSMDIELPSTGEKFIASEGVQKVKHITINVNEPIHYHKDIEKVLTEDCKKDGQKTVVLDSKGTKFDVIWEGHNYYIESETNDIIKDVELNQMKKIMGYNVGNYNKKPKPMKK